MREAGFEPVGLVMGSSIFQVGRNLPDVPQGQPGCELENTTQALYDARELAMGRMEEEAEALGADGVIGVRLTMNLSKDPRRVQWEQYRVWTRWSKEAGFLRPASVPPAGWFPQWNDVATMQWNLWCRRLGWSQVPFPPWSQAGQSGYTLGPNCAEFMAVGTAIRHRAGEPYRNAQGKPFQSDLSGQDFWMLIRSGYRPVGFVMGNCVYYVPPRTCSGTCTTTRAASSPTIPMRSTTPVSSPSSACKTRPRRSGPRASWGSRCPNTSTPGRPTPGTWATPRSR